MRNLRLNGSNDIKRQGQTAMISPPAPSAAARRGRPCRRRAVAALVLAGTAAVAGAPAFADLTGLPLPDRTTGAAVAARAPTALGGAHTVVVHGGDTLWSISARLLGGAATDARVTRTWHRLHRANLARIGPDADLILPGTRLVVPADLPSHRKEAS
jgi:nucleoid-associated protein YgaU